MSEERLAKCFHVTLAAVPRETRSACHQPKSLELWETKRCNIVIFPHTACLDQTQAPATLE